MKSNFNQIVLAIVLAISNFSIFAQGPDPDNLPGDLNPNDTPINDYLILLGFIAVCFAYYSFAKTKKTV